MKSYAGVAFVLTLVLVLIGCQMPFGDAAATTTAADGGGDAADTPLTEDPQAPQPLPGEPQAPGEPQQTSFSLPEPTITTEARAAARSFTFETLVPLSLEVTVTFYARDDDGRLLEEPLSDGQRRAFARLETISGDAIMGGATDPNGVLATVVHVPAATEELVLVVEAEGFQSRSVQLPSVRTHSAASVDVALAERGTGPSGARFSVAGGDGEDPAYSDSDGDGVPDVYDAFPDDETSAFVRSVPASGVLTIAFEDLFGRANAGDADYNDFIAEYSVQEITNTDGLVTRLEIDATAKVKLAGYNHRFGIRIDDFVGTAALERSYVDRSGRTIEKKAPELAAPVEITLFKSTHRAVGQEASFTLRFAQPQDRSVTMIDGDPVEPLSEPPFNPYLYVYNTRNDVHLIGREPLSSSRNPDSDFRDEQGFPWALLVPSEWEHPAEGKRIDSDEWYPRFTDWRESGGTEHTDWYNFKGEPFVPGEDGPAPVTGIDPEPSVTDPVIWPNTQTYQLQIDLGAGTEPTYYRTVEPLPEWITLDEGTGEVIVDSFAASPALDYNTQRQATVEFYTSDNADPADDEASGSTLNDPFAVTFTIERGAPIAD